MVLMYTKSQCPQCVIAKGRLKLANIEFTEVFVDKDPAARQAMVDAGHRSVPIFYVDGVSVELKDLLQ